MNNKYKVMNGYRLSQEEDVDITRVSLNLFDLLVFHPLQLFVCILKFRRDPLPNPTTTLHVSISSQLDSLLKMEYAVVLDGCFNLIDSMISLLSFEFLPLSAASFRFLVISLVILSREQT
jgi:hypothetical protein